MKESPTEEKKDEGQGHDPGVKGQEVETGKGQGQEIVTGKTGREADLKNVGVVVVVVPAQRQGSVNHTNTGMSHRQAMNT